MPSAEANLGGALKVDTDFWIRNGEALEKRFDAWAPKICVQQTDDDDDDYTDQGSCQDNRGNLRPRNGSAAKSGHDKAHSHDHPMTATDEK